MTLETLERVAIHRGNGAATSFPYSFPILSSTDVVVKLQNYTTGEITSTLTTAQYSISGLGHPSGGSVTYPLSGDPLSDAFNIVIERTVPLTQNLEMENYGGFYPASVEEQLDRIVMQVQQLAEEVNRSVRVAVGGSAYHMQLNFADGDTPMKSGDYLVPGPNLPGLASSLIAQATAQANRAESEADAAERARDLAQQYTSNAVAQGNVPIYSSASALIALEIPDGLDFIRTNGYYSANGFGAALYYLMDELDPDVDGQVYSNGGLKRWALANQIIDPFMFGAVGDGLTDDTVPVQKALSRGGYVRIGEHFTTAGLTVGDNTAVEGMFPGISGIYLDPDVDDIPLSSVSGARSNIALRNFIIDPGYEDVLPVLGYHGLVMSDVTNLTIQGLHIKSTKEFAALIRRSTRVIVNSSRVENSGINRDGFKFLSCTGVTFNGNIVHSGDDCVSFSGENIDCDGLTIQGNVFSSDYARAVLINTTQTNPSNVRNVSILGNIIERADSTGIVVEVYDGNAQVENVIIAGNTFKNFGLSENNTSGFAWGIRVRGSAAYPIKNVGIFNNVFTVKNVPTTKVAYGANITFAAGVVVSGNMVDFDQALHADSSGFIIGTVGEPVYDFQVSGNFVNMRGNGNYGIHISRSSRGNVLGNTVLSPLATGIRGSGDVTNPCEYITVKDNKIYDPLGVPVMQRGIRSEGTGDYWIIEDNEIRNAAIAAAITFVGSNNKVRNNLGFVTSNKGTTTLLAGNTEVQVSHGLNITPNIGDIIVTLTSGLGSAAYWYVDPASITGGSFKIKVNAAPGSDITFAWRIVD